MSPSVPCRPAPGNREIRSGCESVKARERPECRRPFLGCLVLFGIGVLAMVGVGAASSREAATLGIHGRVVEDGFGERWVQLRGVHPAFSRALAILLGR